MLDMDGNKIEVGSYVGFKNNIEEYGRVKGFDRGWVVVTVWDDYEGEDVDVNVDPRRCWKNG